MEERQALSAFGALSQETRLRIVRALVIAGPDGMPAGSVAEAVNVSATNVSFHLKALEQAGLVSQQRVSRSIIYTACYEALGELVRFLMDDCCAGHPEICAPATAAGSRCVPAVAEKRQ
jgi:DNA-binding transcriptional ArsR family regulator